jgi:rhodanese-related sulfurtransferase
MSGNPSFGVPAIDWMLWETRLTLPPRPKATDLDALYARRALIVDIRPVGVRQRDGELAGAVVVDRNQLEWRLDPTSPYRIAEVTGPDQEIVVVCDEGYASSLAAATLQRLGLHRATDLDGGFQAVVALTGREPTPSAAPADPVATT